MINLEMDRLLSKIARLYYLENMNQDRIAERFNINRVRVSRYLKKARERDLVQITVKSPPESFPAIERAIEKTYNLRECIIVPSHENPQDTLKDMAASLSSLFERILRDGDYLGVNYGITLKGISSYLSTLKKQQINVVPIVGGIGRTETGIHTNYIAKQFADALGGISYVINAPAILDSREAKEMLMRDSNTKEIFELFRHLSCVIFSFSDLGPESNYARIGFLSAAEIGHLRDMGSVGDVNLDFIDAEGKHIPNGVFDRVIALPIAGIRKVKNVIGIAFGKRKIEITRAVLKGGIVKVLVIDKTVADGVARG